MKAESVAIDGPAGSGKSTIARLLAKRLGYTYIDTGAMYRAAAFAARRAGVKPDDAEALEALMNEIDISFSAGKAEPEVFLNNEDVTNAIRTPRAGEDASIYSELPLVRKKMVELQQKMAREENVVMEGRDIGTVVMPDAKWKFYMDADPKIRARRRADQLREKGIEVDEDEILEQVLERDRRDSERELSPLKAAPDSTTIDTTHLDIEGVLDKVMDHIKGENPGRG